MEPRGGAAAAAALAASAHRSCGVGETTIAALADSCPGDGGLTPDKEAQRREKRERGGEERRGVDGRLQRRQGDEEAVWVARSTKFPFSGT